MRADGLYASEDLDVAEQVRAWCAEHGADPELRIVLAGFAGEGHESLVDLGWREVEWFRSGFLKGGMGNTGGSGNHKQAQERLWLSPHCLRPADPEDDSVLSMF